MENKVCIKNVSGESEKENDKVVDSVLPQKTIDDLHPEIWRMYIIPKFSSAKEFHTLINSSVKLREMLHEDGQIEENLLPLVLPILLKHWTISREYLLKWRQVNQAAHRMIEEVVDAEVVSPGKYQSKGTRWTRPTRVFTPIYYKQLLPLQQVIKDIQKQRFDFRKPQNLVDFMGCVGDGGNKAVSKASKDSKASKPSKSYYHHRSPIIGNAVTLCLDAGGNDMNLALVFLSNPYYSHNLSIVTIKVSESSLNMLFSAMAYMGTVKILVIQGVIYVDSLLAPHQLDHFYQLGQEVELASLEVLDLANFICYHRDNNIQSVYAMILQRCGSRLTRLFCSSFFFFKECTLTVLRSGRLPNIRFLSIDVVGEQGLKCLQQLGSLQLENIQLNNALFDKKDSSVLKALDTFQKTLVNIQLYGVCVSYYKWLLMGSDSYYPKLVKFSCHSCHLKLLDFWIMVKQQYSNLEELVVYGGEPCCLLYENVRFWFHLGKLHGGYKDDILQGFRYLARLQKVVVYDRVHGHHPPASLAMVEICRNGSEKIFYPIKI